MLQRVDEPDDEYRERPLDCFANSVYLYDNKVIITFNLTNEKATLENVTFSSLHSTKPDGNSTIAGSYNALFEWSGNCRFEPIFIGEFELIPWIMLILLALV